MALIDLAENVNNITKEKDLSVPWLGHYLKNRGQIFGLIS